MFARSKAGVVLASCNIAPQGIPASIRRLFADSKLLPADSPYRSGGKFSQGKHRSPILRHSEKLDPLVLGRVVVHQRLRFGA